MADIYKTAATISPALPVGTMLGSYIIRKVIGSGGFGITYLAQEGNSDNLVVIKENYPSDISFRDMNSLTVDPAGQYRIEAYNWALKRFLDEAKILSRLSHPNIVPVHHAFKALGTAYYVMPYVEGTELNKAASTPDNITAEWLMPVLEKILSALGYIHEQGFIHRDIKPNNILMRADGEPVLIDFGTTRALESTHSHTHMGTPGFMPIEQFSARGNRGPWTDFYALGATCYYLITGEVPPSSTDRVEEDEYIPLVNRRSLTKRFPKHVLSSIDKALQINYRQRWQSAQEWLEALNGKPSSQHSQKSTQPETTAHLSSPKKKNKIISIISILTLIALGGGGYFYYHQTNVKHQRTDRRPARPVAANSAKKSDDVKPQLTGISPEQYNSSLYAAAGSGDAEKIRILLEAGADVNWANEAENNNTPLLIAVEKGHTECVRTLLTVPGIDVNTKNRRGNTPLHSAISNNRIECMRLLLTAPWIDVNKITQYHSTPLSEAIKNDRLECVRLLLAAPGINVNKRDTSGTIPLVYAINKGYIECVRLLLAAPGIDVNQTDYTYPPPLHSAIRGGHTECVRLLLAVPSIEINKIFGSNTPLSEASRRGHTECADLIRAAGGR